MLANRFNRAYLARYISFQILLHAYKILHKSRTYTSIHRGFKTLFILQKRDIKIIYLDFSNSKIFYENLSK